MRRIFVIIAIFVSLAILCGCSDSPNGPALLEAEPSNLSPGENTVITGTVTVLTWSYPEDSLAALTGFDVYLGSGSSLEKVKAGITDTFCVVGSLEPGREYSWRVTAIKTDGPSKSGPLWSFHTSDDYIFPLVIGQEWTYRHELLYDNFDPDSLRNEYPPGYSGSSTMEILRQSWVPEGSPPMVEIEVKDYLSNPDRPITNTLYVGNTDSGLYIYGDERGGILGPAKPQLDDGVHYRFNGLEYGSFDELLTGLPVNGLSPSDFFWGGERSAAEPPYLGLAYPLEAGSQWTYSQFNYRIDKRVVGREEVTVDAGTFNCWVVQSMWDIDDDGEWDTNIERLDYYGSDGLIKRAYVITGISVIDESNVVLGTMDVYQSFDLTHYTLP